MIELSHVTKTFGGAKRALDDLTLTVPQCAVYGPVSYTHLTLPTT